MRLLFLIGAVVSITLFSNPAAFFVIIPVVTLGCVVMTGKITNSVYFQIKNFKGYLSQFSKEGQEELYTEMKKEINSLRLYRIIAKVLPDIVVLAKLHANKKDKGRQKEVQHLKEVLKGGN
ncbi:hypothetical protein [Wolbachia pipientis]|uniref:hypothetical protein n=1 Tax=Wolbachia pipientis TaxID=955 RepID=UPI0025A37C59|nr:hypothetical protein [Wolbachia pipientis]MDM8335203.1 hypothetical protein [Wolbachia pipientis]